MRRSVPAVTVTLNAVAIGILIFLVWDVLTSAWEPIDTALATVHEHHGSLSPVFGYGALFSGGLAVGLLGLVGYERHMHRVPKHDGDPRSGYRVGRWSPAQRAAVSIAVGIGLHNFAEGLAIGQSAADGEVSLAALLVIGFALHNATEGFGIVAPLAAELDPSGAPQRPSWRFLLAVAFIGGGPTFVGTAVGHGFHSDAVSVAFLTLAAGSIIFVVAQLLGVAARARRADLLGYGLLIGLLAGFATDAIVTAGGA